MEKEKRIFFFTFLVLCFLGRCCAVGAATPTPAKIATVQSATTSPVQPQPVDFGVCNKFFKLDNQKLFYLTLAGMNANRFKIDEIQSRSGYILFTIAQRQYLASIINIDSQNSMLKIIPCNNIYYFPVGVVQNMFKYIELNINTPVQNIATF